MGAARECLSSWNDRRVQTADANTSPLCEKKMNTFVKFLTFIAAIIVLTSHVEGYYIPSVPLTEGKGMLNRHKVTAHEIKRRSNVDAAMMDKLLEQELQYAQQLASGIITDLRSLLVDIRKDPSIDSDRLLRLS